MWICPRCGEESEDNFEACWNCQRQRPGNLRPVTDSAPDRSALGMVVTGDDSPVTHGSVGGSVSRRAGEYLAVPFIGQIKHGFFSSQDARAVSEQLQAVINEHARRGWEFHSLQKVDVAVTPGCLASLFGASSRVITFDQLVFRRRQEQ